MVNKSKYTSKWLQVPKRTMRYIKFWVATGFRQNISGVILGLVISSALSLVIWGFAYFGFIDLGLPKRFEFEKLDHVVRSRIPSSYNYTTEKVNFRDSQNETLVVVARDKDAYGVDQSTDSDIVLLLDKTEKEFKITYMFQPEKPVDGLPLHAIFLDYKDVSEDQRVDVIIGWSYIGASFSPPAVMVIGAGMGKDVVSAGLPHLSNYKYPADYRGETLVNRYDKAAISTENVYFFRVKKGEIVTVKRNDDACSACTDEHIYNINFFHLSEGRISEWGSPQTGIRGYSSLEEILSDRGYERSR